MYFLLFMLMSAPAPASAEMKREVYVSRPALDCWLRRARPSRGSAADLLFLNLRKCPGSVMNAAPILNRDRLNAFPRFTRRTFPTIAASTPRGREIDVQPLLTRAEINCLIDPARRRRVRSVADPERYLINLSRCR